MLQSETGQRFFISALTLFRSDGQVDKRLPSDFRARMEIQLPLHSVISCRGYAAAEERRRLREKKQAVLKVQHNNKDMFGVSFALLMSLNL